MLKKVESWILFEEGIQDKNKNSTI